MKNCTRFMIATVALVLMLGFGWGWHLALVSKASSAGQRKDPTTRPRRGEGGSPRINFTEGRELQSGSDVAQNGASQPTTLASADFDSDGIKDLVVADSTGAIRLHLGTADTLYPDSPQAKAARTTDSSANSSDPQPFRQTGKTHDVSIVPDFLFAGDFNADGHADLLAATRGGSSLHLLAGHGTGGFAPETKIAVGGEISSVAAGEIGRADGQSDVAVSVTSAKGARLLVFEHPEGAFKYRPEAIKLGAPATDIVLGDLDDDSYQDISIAQGHFLIVVHGRGQAYPFDMLKESGIKRPAPIVQTRRLGFSISSLVFGDFGARRGDALVLLSEDGSVHVLEQAAERQKPTNAGALSRAAKGNAAASQFAPAGVDASGYMVVEQRKPQSAGEAEKLGLALVDRSLVGRDPKEYLRQRAEKAAKADAAESSKLSAGERAKARAEERQRMKAERERAKADFMRQLAPPPSSLAGFDLYTVTSDARLSGAAKGFGGAKLIKARVSDSGRDDLILLDNANRQLQVVAASPASSNPQSAIRNPQSEVVSLDAGGAPIAVLPLRLNADALSDLIILREGSPSPFLLPSAAANTFVVNSTSDENVCDDGGTCTLRGAIARANGSSGADTINFQIGSGAQTIAPGAQLPTITEPVTIDGTTQPGYAGAPLIEITGINVPAGKDGLRVNASNCVVRGLVINEFSSEIAENGFSQIGGNGLTIFSFAGFGRVRNNIIEGNYLGTDLTGTLDKGNDATGLLIFDSDDNTIGGPTAAARNVMSGNGNGEQNIPLQEQGSKPGVGLAVTVGNDTQIKGNFIGTDASGASKINNTEGIFLSGKNNLVGGDEAGAGNTISGNGDTRPVSGTPNSDYCLGRGVGVEVLTNNQTGEILTLDNIFKGNKIGTTADGGGPLGNCSTGITFSAMTNTVVGSITETGRNTISGNTFDGVYCLPSFNFTGGEPHFGQCTIVGNNVGTDITGTQAIPNNFDNPVYEDQIGLFYAAGAVRVSLDEGDMAVVGSPGGTTSGGPCTGFCNLVSGNDSSLGGISRDSGAGTAVVANNYVGTNRAGTAALPNDYGMVMIFGDVAIGAVFTDENGFQISGGNLISGNETGGVGAGDFNHDIVGNLIGTSVDGLSAIPNGGVGMDLRNHASQITVGGTSPLHRNVIAGNTGNGISLISSSGITILNNHIGVNAAGEPLGNGGHGINVLGVPVCPEDDYPQSVQVGGRGANQGNVIKNNVGIGVLLTVDSNFTQGCQGGQAFATNTVPVIGNSIANNGGLGIDLAMTPVSTPDEGDGVTPNDCLDADEGPNRLQNFPVLTAPVFNPDGTVTVGGGFQSTPVSSFTLDFYSNTAADPTKYGEGETHIGSKTVQTDSSGITTFEFSSTMPVAANLKITATATDVEGNTSEFSCAAGECTGGTGGSPQEVEDLLAPTCLTPIIVNINTDEPDANPNEGICDVDVNVTGSQCSLRAAIETANAHTGFDLINFDIPGSGVQTISPTSALPEITERVFIDATTQPGYATAPLIELNGINAGDSHGLVFTGGSNSSAVFALTVNRFAQAGILFGSNENRLEKSYIGIFADGSGFDPGGRQATGVLILGSKNVIGGTMAAARNVLSGNSQHQVKISSSSAKNNVVATNFIGVAIDGQTIIRYPLQRGVELIDGASDNRIGGTSIEEVNAIAGHEIGVHIANNSKRNVVLHNQISDCEAGVKIADASDNTIGGARGNTADSSSSRNQIVDNLIGIFIGGTGAASQTKGNKIQGNWIGLLGDETLDRSNELGIRIAAAEGTLIGTGDIEFHNVVSGNTETGIVLEKDAVSNFIRGNFIGTDTAGLVAKPNRYGIRIAGAENEVINNVISGNTEYGVVIDALVEGDPVPLKNVINNNRIGTRGSGEAIIPNRESGILLDGKESSVTSNIISGNIKYGIDVRNDENSIVNNKIGTNVTGNIPLGNGEAGIIVSSSTNNITSNTISGNQAGIVIVPNPATPTTYPSFNVIQKNLIGTNSNGTAAVPNTTFGIGLATGANNNLIGGTDANVGNVISGNGSSGIVLRPAGAIGPVAPFKNKIQGNFIGTDKTGTVALKNGKAGVYLAEGSNENLIGGFDSDIPSARNIISGNGLSGIDIAGEGSTLNRISGNYIGTAADGTTAMGNGLAGVIVRLGAHHNIIGGREPNAGNTITFNLEAVAIIGSAGCCNTVDPNVIFGNETLGIELGCEVNSSLEDEASDLTGCGTPLPNDVGDPDTGANLLQNYPEFTLASINTAGNLILEYKVDSATGNSNYGTDGLYLEFFKADAGLEGQTFIGSTHYTVADYNNGTPGIANFNAGAASVLGVSVGDKIVATATDADGNTSEFTGTNVGIVGSPTAATAIIEGQIITNDGEPVAGVVIALSGTQNRRTISDDSGRYRFTQVESTGFYSVEPSRANFNFAPANRSFSALGHTTNAAFTAIADTTQSTNPLDTPEYFVRQHYLDFLGREPDEAGFNFWSDQIRECGTDAGCIERRRINVSAAYFLSIEFQQTGGLVDRLYRTSFERLPLYAEFLPDTRAVARDVVVGREGWQAKLEANKQAFVAAFVQRPAFIDAYGDMSNDLFVDTLISHTQVSFTAAERDALVSGLTTSTMTRAGALRTIAENTRFASAKFNEAFVMMQYFGYLRRDPDASGYAFWLNKLNEFDGNFERAEMVKAFIVSGEYRARFPQ